LKDLKELPPNLQHEISDISIAIEAGGRSLETLINLSPGGKHLAKAFGVQETTKNLRDAFNQTAQGLNTSKIEEEKIKQSGSPVFPEDPEEIAKAREIEEVRKAKARAEKLKADADKKRIRTQGRTPYEQLKWKIFGGKPDQDIIDQR
jgi:hypothetical protein